MMNTVIELRKGESDMKGYNTENGYMGYVDGDYRLFASESDYRNLQRQAGWIRASMISDEFDLKCTIIFPPVIY